jgi:creatinine amidohydrolase
MPPRPYVLASTTFKTVRLGAYELAVLPWGATEAHNFHLPYATDTIQTEAVAIESARLAWERGARLLVLPAVPFGVNTGQLDVPICLNMNPTTQLAVLTDIAHSLVPHGIRKLVILNGHGGNDFKALVRELQPRVPLLLVAVNWYASVNVRAYFDDPGDHAGDLETSVMLHVSPDLVLPLGDAGPGQARTFRVQGMREGWAWTPRKWTAVTDDTGVGDPRQASAVKGKTFFEATTTQLATLLVELAAADPDALYV